MSEVQIQITLMQHTITLCLYAYQSLKHRRAYLLVTVCSIAIACKNLVNFGLVTPELTKLICELLVRHRKNWRVFSRISLPTGQIYTMLNVFTV